MAQSIRKVIDPQRIYDVIELIGTSANFGRATTRSRRRTPWRAACHQEVVEKDMVIRNGKVDAYRTKGKVSFKYEGHGLDAA